MPKYTYDRKRPSASKRGYGRKWARAARDFLEANPLCAECERNGRPTPAKLVDHITPHKGKQSLMWNRKNWQPLCQDCHNLKTAEERTGKKIVKGHDASGMPTHPDHPWNVQGSSQDERGSIPLRQPG